MDLLWWHWVVVGLALGMGELALGSFFVIWFGLGAILVGLVLALIPELPFAGQVILWTVSSVVFAVLWFRVLRQQLGGTHAGQSHDVIGEIGVLVSAVEPFQRGEVRFQKPLMGAEAWPCISDSAIKAGQRVRVASVDGQLLKVAPVEGATS